MNNGPEREPTPNPPVLLHRQPEPSTSQMQMRILELQEQTLYLQAELIGALKSQVKHAPEVSALRFWKSLALMPSHEHIYDGTPASGGFLPYVISIFNMEPDLFAADQDKCAFALARFSKDQMLLFRDLVQKGQLKGTWEGMKAFVRRT